MPGRPGSKLGKRGQSRRLSPPDCPHTSPPAAVAWRSGTSLVRRFVLAVFVLLLALPASGKPRVFQCKEPLPEFTLGPASNPSAADLAKLCACVWSKLPDGGWERTVAAKLRAGGRTRAGAAARFRRALALRSMRAAAAASSPRTRAPGHPLAGRATQ